jgi:hypothetical protein
MTVRLEKGKYTPGNTDTDHVKGHDGIPPGDAKNQDQHRGHVLGAKLGGTVT